MRRKPLQARSVPRPWRAIWRSRSQVRVRDCQLCISRSGSMSRRLRAINGYGATSKTRVRADGGFRNDGAELFGDLLIQRRARTAHADRSQEVPAGGAGLRAGNSRNRLQQVLNGVVRRQID